MKLVRSIVFIVGFSLFSNSIFSHGICRNRNSCSGTVNTAWMYKAKARVSKYGWPSIATDKDCPYTGGNNYANAHKDNGCARQTSTNSYGNWYFSGSVYRKPRSCARGNSSSELYYDLIKDGNEGLDDYEASEIRTKGTIFGKQSCSVNGITGFLITKGSEVYSSFEVIMWVPSDENDTLMSDEKIFYRGKITLVNGKVNITGDFPLNTYKITQSINGEYRVDFSDINISALLPKGINGETDIIEIVGISDGGVIEKNIISKMIQETELNDNFKLSVYPNPTKAVLNLSISNHSDELFTAKLYDMSGKEIKVLFTNRNDKDISNYQINLVELGLKEGVYFILVKSNENKYLQKVILE